jgi:DNA-binding response OmpR family regulator
MEHEPALKILVVEDNDADRFLLARIIKEQGYEIITARDGVEAVDKYQQDRPSIILMDALMPNMDGITAVRQIKSLAGDSMVLVLFLTSLNDEISLVSCLEAGGDDFITKPYRPAVLTAKVRAFSRMLSMNSTVCRQRDEILQHNERLLQEQQVAKKIFDNVTRLGCLDERNIRYLLSPMSVFNGDVLLAARKPSGGMVVFVGDFTGHGLPAAIGALPIAEIFYGMVNKGFGIENILREINQKLKRFLPVGYFCCGCMVDLSYSKQRIRVWNGGLPDPMLKRRSGEVLRFPSAHLPLGILSPQKFSTDCVEVETGPGDHICLWSDGIVEARDREGVQFGLKRVYEALKRVADDLNPFDAIVNAAHQFIGAGMSDDDFTLGVIEMLSEQEAQRSQPGVVQASAVVGGSDWAFSYQMFNSTIREFNPVPLLLHVATEVPGLKQHSQNIYLIFAELIANAIDHGLLGLDSSMKQDADGFRRYYELRASRLESLDGHAVGIDVRHHPDLGGGLLIVRIRDTGRGFDVDALPIPSPDQLQLSGRGVQLLRTICESVEYLGSGNEVEVRYRWFFDHPGTPIF